MGTSKRAVVRISGEWQNPRLWKYTRSISKRFIYQITEFGVNYEGNRRPPSQQRQALLLSCFPKGPVDYSIIGSWAGRTETKSRRGEALRNFMHKVQKVNTVKTENRFKRDFRSSTSGRSIFSDVSSGRRD